MVLFFRTLILALFILLLAYFNRETARLSIFGLSSVLLPLSAIIAGSAALGFLLCRWYDAFRQFSLIDIIKAYSDKVSELEKALSEKEKNK